MKKLAAVMLCIFFSTLFLACSNGTDKPWATTETPTTVLHKLGVIPIDNWEHFSGFDISYADSNGMYYLADANAQGNAFHIPPGGGRIDIIDTTTNTVAGYIYGFQPPSTVTDEDEYGTRSAGPAGILVIGDTPTDKGELWASDGDSTVKVIDLNTNTIVDSISTGGRFRCDELSYDPDDHIIMVGNDSEFMENSGLSCFVTFIDTQTHAVLGHIVYDGSSTSTPCTAGYGPDATGVEQSVYDSGYFYQNIPGTTDKPDGECDKIDPLTMQIVARYDAPAPEPSGLALGPDHHLLMGTASPATAIIDDQDGSTVALIPQVYYSDEVWYNPTDNMYYLAAGAPGLIPEDPTAPLEGVLGVIDAETNTWLQNLDTSVGSHSVAASPVNGRVYVPNSDDGGIDVFGPEGDTL